VGFCALLHDFGAATTRLFQGPVTLLFFGIKPRGLGEFGFNLRQ